MVHPKLVAPKSDQYRFRPQVTALDGACLYPPCQGGSHGCAWAMLTAIFSHAAEPKMLCIIEGDSWCGLRDCFTRRVPIAVAVGSNSWPICGRLIFCLPKRKAHRPLKDGFHSYNHNLKRNAFLGVRDSEYDVVEMGLRFMSRA
jgi:hypothetical protein